MKELTSILQEVFPNATLEVGTHYFAVYGETFSLEGYTGGEKEVNLFFDAFVPKRREKKVHLDMQHTVLPLLEKINPSFVNTVVLYDNRTEKMDATFVFRTETSRNAIQKQKRRVWVKRALPW